MIIIKRVFILILFFLFFITNVNALTVSSEAVILMDQESNRILFSKNLHKAKLIASITKIMTAVIAIESNRLDEIVKVDDRILKAYGSNIYIEIGEEISLRDLVYGLMLHSGNDAALAIASFLSKSEALFVTKMNDKAKSLKMNNTIFVNPHGLDEREANISTVYDMALLTKYANSLPEYKKIVGTKKHIAKSSYKTYVWHNKNKLLNIYKYTTGGKTGFTEKARRTLVSSATKGNTNLIVVTLNDYDDWNTHQKLYEYAFNNYQRYLILNKDTFELTTDYYVDLLYIKNNYYYPLLPSELEAVSITAKVFKSKHYQNQDKVGELEVYFKDQLIHIEDLFIEAKEKPKVVLKWWHRLWNWIN